MSETLKLVNLHPNDWATFFTVAFIILFAAIAVIKAFDWVRSRLGITTAAERRLQTMEDNVTKLNEMMVHDREETNNVREQMKGNFEKLNNNLGVLGDRITSLEKRLTDNEDRDKEYTQAQIKNSIAKAYQAYHKTQCWTSMEKESMLSLIKSFESAGNMNTFVHDVVEKELYTWEVTDEKA